jgi:hypothetical protein
VAIPVLVDEARAVVRVGNVRSDALGAELRGGGFDLLARPSGERQLEPVVLQRTRDRETDTRRAPGDQRGPFDKSSLQVRR